MSGSDGRLHGEVTTFTGSAAVIMRRVVTVVVFVIAGLAFVFSFGNGWALGIKLGVPSWIALLVTPAVDLSVVALLASIQYLRANGVATRLLGPRLLLIGSGLITLALNTAYPILIGEYGRAAFDGVAPLLLLGWSEVGPKLLAALHGTVPVGPGPSSVVRDEAPRVSAELAARAKHLDAQHREATGKRLTRDGLRAQLGVSNSLAGEVLRAVRAEASP